MANKIQIKRGARANLPALSDGELALCKDTGELFVGNGGNNQQIGAKMQAGSWTPMLPTYIGGEVMFDGTPSGSYVRIGNIVAVSFSVSVYASGNPSGVLRLNGLPFPVASGAAGVLSLFDGRLNMTGLPIASIDTGSSAIWFRYADFSGSVTTYSDITADMLLNSQGYAAMKATIVYLT